jgi:trehalose-6-phosphate synthase
MKTAVEFLHSEYNRILGSVLVTPQQIIEMSDALEKAKKMEEEQKKELVVATYTYLKMKDCHLPYGMEYLNKISELDEEAEQYYNETFKQPEQ